jgi:2,3-bisphosphoglycerate-dependent phosphoglycerate mutase
MSTLVIVRHGQSQWNLENRFTGEIDVPLTEKGRREALKAGQQLKGYTFDFAFTSVLIRAIETLQIILDTIGQQNLPVIRDKALNERNYGELQGLNKSETARQFGDEQVQLWRRSYAVAPPGGESLKDTANRVIPYFENCILPLLEDGKNILISAHGNSLRALMMHLEKMSPEEIVQTELPTGKPRIYHFNDHMELTSFSYL